MFNLWSYLSTAIHISLQFSKDLGLSEDSKLKSIFLTVFLNLSDLQK